MIVLNILCKNEKKVFDITNFLKKNAYALETYVDVNKLVEGKKEKVFVRIFFLTKSLLFESICNDLVQKFESEELTIYSSPVTQIEQSYWEKLREKLKPV
ncbi:MAG: hypothetical protein IPG89_14160 [Bacteroidetes bacterium]|nr:hypothetical protein [Bacteroidota bacterium]